MPNVGSNEFKAAKGANDFVSGIPLGKNGTSGGPNNDGWKYGIAVYAHNGTDWVEVWNARPQMVSSTITQTSATELSFTGTADPNNFLTTASFELRIVGGSYVPSTTTTTGLGNNIDGAVGYAVTYTDNEDGTYQNWEARAKGVNTAGTDYGSVIALDCRQNQFAYTNGAEYSTGGDCATKRIASDRTYTKTGCFTYTVAGANYDNADNKCPDKAYPCYEAGVFHENTENPCGTCGYYTSSYTSYSARAVTGPCSDVSVTNANGECRDLDARVRIYSEAFQIGHGIEGNLYWHGYNPDTGVNILAWVGPKNTDGCGFFELPMYKVWYCGTDVDGINSERPYWIEKFACQSQFTNYPE